MPFISRRTNNENLPFNAVVIIYRLLVMIICPMRVRSGWPVPSLSLLLRARANDKKFIRIKIIMMACMLLIIAAVWRPFAPSCGKAHKLLFARVIASCGRSGQRLL